MPNGLSPEGLPLGVQVIGPYLADDAVLQVAKWMEGVLGRLRGVAKFLSRQSRYPQLLYQ